MPWTLARDFSEAAARLDREAQLAQAIAARTAQAEEKGWKAWVRELTRET